MDNKLRYKTNLIYVVIAASADAVSALHAFNTKQQANKYIKSIKDNYSDDWYELLIQECRVGI